MRVFAVAVFLAYMAVASPEASAAVATMGASTQKFTLTGIGPNGAGQGQAKMTWGSCTYDGTTTTCSLSGPFTGFGGGGTYNFAVSYAGNGAFPLIAVFPIGSDQFFAQALSNYSFVVTLTENNGTVIPFYSFANFNFVYSSPTCTGVATCDGAPVGQAPNATITGPITGVFDPTPTILPSGVITAGYYGAFPAIAPATWIEIYGYNLATTRSQTWAGTDFNGDQAPTALGGTPVIVGTTITGPITGGFDPTPTILTSGVITAGYYGAFPAIAPATWIEIYGYNLATTRSQTWAGTDFNGDQAPTALGGTPVIVGTTVTVAGKPAFVNFVSPGQVN